MNKQLIIRNHISTNYSLQKKQFKKHHVFTNLSVGEKTIDQKSYFNKLFVEEKQKPSQPWDDIKKHSIAFTEPPVHTVSSDHRNSLIDSCSYGKMSLAGLRNALRQTYHAWMKSPELQHLTGSEPLSLEEEYNMQKSWQEDENKCTFIILDRQLFLKTGEEIESMIGDTNLYFNDPNEPHTAECEIMIAEELARGRKMGVTAIILMLRYGIEFLRVGKYRAKIKLDNTISIGMFKKLGFYETSKSQVFQELTVEKQVDEEWVKWLIDETPEYQIDDNWRED